MRVLEDMKIEVIFQESDSMSGAEYAGRLTRMAMVSTNIGNGIRHVRDLTPRRKFASYEHRPVSLACE
jgi:hypothetical protein